MHLTSETIHNVKYHYSDGYKVDKIKTGLDINPALVMQIIQESLK